MNKFYYGIPAALIGGAAMVLVQHSAIALTAPEVSKIAEPITVLIRGTTQSTQGSGVIIASEANGIYYVLTADHVVELEDKYEVVTFDKRSYPVDFSSVIKLPGVDLAILQFTSTNTTYKEATLAKNAAQADVGANVYISGYPNPGTVISESIRQLSSGQISARPSKALESGYAMVYTNITSAGMSGGPVLDENGRVVGIHGRTEEQLTGGPAKPGFNLGIPIDTFWSLAPKAYYNKGLEKLKGRNYPGAIADFGQALRFGPSDADAYTGRGYALFAQGNYPGAIADATKAIQSNPNSADAHRLRGASLAKQNKHSEAIADFNQAIRINSNLADAYSLRAVSRAQLGDTGANEDASKAINLAPNSVNYKRRSIVRSILKDSDGARVDEQKSTELASASGDGDGYQMALNRGSGISETLSQNTQPSPKPTQPVTPQRTPQPQPKPQPQQVRTTPLQTASKPTQPVTPPRTSVQPQPKPQPQQRSNTREVAASNSTRMLLDRTFNEDAEVFAVAISPDGKTIATGIRGGKIQIRDRQTGEVRQTLNGHVRGVKSLAFSPDGQTLASGGEDAKAKLWNLQNGSLLHTFGGFQGHVHSVVFSSSGQTLATGSGDGTVKLWLMSSKQVFREFKGHSEGVYSVAISRDGKTLATGSGDKTIKIWSVQDGKLLNTLSGHTDLILAVAFSPDGQTLVSGSLDKSIKIWNVSSGQLNTISLKDSVYAVAISPDGNSFAAGVGTQAKFWNLSGGQEIGNLSGYSRPVRSVIFSNDGQTFVTGSEDNSVKIWQAAAR